MFTHEELVKEVATVCDTPLVHVETMRQYAETYPEDAGFCMDAVCRGCDIPAQAKRWCGAVAYV
ncbi:hypothetical protein LCGC14_0811140, partial [marine sediment metagenome]